MKKYFSIASAAVILSLAAAASAQDTVTLRFYTTQPEATERPMIETCAAELGINVDATFVQGGVNNLMTELRALNTGGSLPDVFWMSSGFVAEFVLDGLLLNIQEYVDRDIMPQAENYFVSAFEAGRVNGDLYAFPNHFVHTVMFYNIDAFEEAGVPLPTTDWTWEDFRSAAEALTIDKNGDGLTDQYGYYFFGRYAHIEAWVYQNNGDWLNADKTAFEPTPEAVATIEFLKSLIDDGLAPTPAEMQGLPNPFTSGLAAMWLDGSWSIDTIRSNATFRFGVAIPPRGPSWQRDIAHGWSDMYAVGAFTQHPEESWALINCLTGPNRTADLVEAGKIPVYRPVAESEAWLELDKQPANKALLLEWAEFIGPNAFTPGWGEWRGYVDGAGLQGQLDEVFNGNRSIEEALNAVRTTVTNVLNRFYSN
ncbi:sugar ABC transporter substrate-binding protein [Aggregatilineales bacterium SYSU G02658]